MKWLSFPIIFISFCLFLSHTSLMAQQNQKEDSDKIPDLGIEVLKIKALPYITIVDSKTLKSYNWWQEDDKKVPTVYKDVLKQILKDLKEEHIHMSFSFTSVKNSEDETSRAKMGIEYVLQGKLIFDAENKMQFELKDINMISTTDQTDLFLQQESESLTELSEIKQLAQKLSLYLRKEEYVPKPEAPAMYIKFKVDLVYNEIEKIQQQIQETFPEIKSLSIYSFTGEDVTFAVRPASGHLLKKIANLNFLKGPYKRSLQNNTLILQPFTEEDFNNEKNY